MDRRPTGAVTVILGGIGVILLIAAAFDILPVSDNTVIFIALACFIIAGVIKRIDRASCCK